MAAKCDRQETPKLPLKFEVANQASIPSFCASLQAMPWATEAEQHISRLDPYVCELAEDVRIFRAGVAEALGTDH